MKGPEKPIELKASWDAYAVFLTLPVLFSCFWLYIALRDQKGWNMLACLATFMAVFGTMLVRYRLTLTSDRISYRNLRGSSELKLSEIERAEIRIADWHSEGRHRPTVCLQVTPFRETGKEPLLINMKVFPKAGIQTVLSYLPIED